MIVTSIDLNSDGVAVASFVVNAPDYTNPYQIKGMTGLDIDGLIPRYYASGMLEGTKFTELVMPDREITMTIGLNPDVIALETASSLRDTLYKAIASTREGLVQLQFNNGATAVAIISGHITKFEVPLFSKNTEVQLTMYCPDGRLRGPDLVNYDVSGWVGGGVTVPIIEDLVSTSPHGFTVNIIFTGNVNPFIFRDSVTPDWQFRIDHAFDADDILQIRTDPGARGVSYQNEGVGSSIQIMDKLAIDSVWPTIFPGTNIYQVNTSQIVWSSLNYYPSYWGV